MPEEKSASPDRIPAPRLSRGTACKLGIATALLAAGRKVAGVVLPLTAHSSAPATPNSATPISMTSKPHIAVIGAPHGGHGRWFRTAQVQLQVQSRKSNHPSPIRR